MPKRLIVACDGTWLNSDSGFSRSSWLPSKSGTGTLQVPSNITRICRALLPEGSDGKPQVTYYQAGLGSEDNAYSFFIGGYLGDGISNNIRDGYAFLARNYQPGDEIFLIGFSRGAFIARSIGGMIGDLGLLTPKGMSYFYPIFKDWENQNATSYRSEFTIEGWENRPRYNGAPYVEKLTQLSLTRPEIPIHTLAVFDTVGSLGVPEIGLFGGRLPVIGNSAQKEYSFINTEIPPRVSYAFQALALDECRKPFSPTLWEMPSQPVDPKLYPLKSLKQCWFPGVHTNIGGGGTYTDTGIADLTLAWMLEQLSPILAFDPDFVLAQQTANVASLDKANAEAAAPWSFGKIYDNTSGVINQLTRFANRTPGSYYRTDHDTGAQTGTRLRDTREFIHPSVRVRMAMHGKGLGDNGAYAPPSLAGWRQYAPGVRFEGKANPWPREFDDVWKWVNLESAKDGETVWIAEEELGSGERALLKRWPEQSAAVDKKT